MISAPRCTKTLHAQLPDATYHCAMRFTDAFLIEMQEQLGRLGLRTCLVCQSDELLFDRRPQVATVGGLDVRAPLTENTNIVYLIRVECSTCGHVLTFNSERFRDGDSPILLNP